MGRSDQDMNKGLSAGPQGALDAILASHLARYPLMEVRDLYKLLHQGALGSEHAVTDIEGVRYWLDCELRQMPTEPAGPLDPLIDPISPDNQIVRGHLRPYIAAGHDPEILLEAFVRTAQEYRGSADSLQLRWDRVLELAAAGQVPFPPPDLDAFLRRMESHGFPAVHHSEAYEAAYRPAYRVVHPAFLDIQVA